MATDSVARLLALTAEGGSPTPEPVAWENVQYKPFETIGSGLSVDEEGELSAAGGKVVVFPTSGRNFTDEEKQNLLDIYNGANYDIYLHWTYGSDIRCNQIVRDDEDLGYDLYLRFIQPYKLVDGEGYIQYSYYRAINLVEGEVPDTWDLATYHGVKDKELPQFDADDAGKVLTVHDDADLRWEEIGNYLPLSGGTLTGSLVLDNPNKTEEDIPSLNCSTNGALVIKQGNNNLMALGDDIITYKSVAPYTNNSLNIGTNTQKYKDLYLLGKLHSGSSEATTADIVRVANTVPSYTSTDAEKVLSVNSSGTGVEWAEAGGSDYTFTNGLTESSGTVSWDLNDRIKAGTGSNAVIIGTGSASGSGATSIGSGIASGYVSFVAGANSKTNSYANYSVVLGENNITSYSNQTVIGKFSKDVSEKAFIVGNGTAANSRSNALTVDWSGNLQCAGLTDGTTTKTMTEVLAGDGSVIKVAKHQSAFTSDEIAKLTDFFDNIDDRVLKVGSTIMSYSRMDEGNNAFDAYMVGYDFNTTTSCNQVAYYLHGQIRDGHHIVTSSTFQRWSEYDGIILGMPEQPEEDGNYVLKCSIVDGVATYSWVAE